MSRPLPDPDTVRDQNRRVLKTLSKWTDDAYKNVKAAADAGLRLKRTANGHVVVYNSHGGSISLSNGASHTSNTTVTQRLEVAKLIAEEELHGRTDADHEAREGARITPVVMARTHTPTPTPESDAMKTSTTVYPCEIEGATFINQHELDRHRTKVGHVQCTEPGCGAWLKNRNSKGPHISIHHRGAKPWEASAKATRGTKRGPRALKVPKYPAPVAEGNGIETDDGQTAQELGDVLAEAEKAAVTEVIVARENRANGLPRPVRSGAPVINTDTDRVELIRAILGEDPQIAALKAERDDWRRKAEELEAKIQIMREALTL